MKKKIVVEPHWRESIKCLRQWFDGFEAGGGKPLPATGNVLWQIMAAIDQAKEKP